MPNSHSIVTNFVSEVSGSQFTSIAAYKFVHTVHLEQKVLNLSIHKPTSEKLYVDIMSCLYNHMLYHNVQFNIMHRL